MSHYTKMIMTLMCIISLCSCAKKNNEMGTYGYDKSFFEKNGIQCLELESQDGLARILVAPGYQGRVMTTTATGDKGGSFGWINYKLIESKKINPQFNPVGGEERFWMGPEGGPFSIYFKPKQEQIYENWKVPSSIDTEKYDLVSSSKNSLKFKKEASLTNASGTKFKVGIERTISLLSKDQISKMLHIELSNAIKSVGYQTDNKIVNKGDQAWTKEGGLLSIWLLGMFNPTPTTTVFIPYDTNAEGTIVHDDYFGKVPSDRLIVENGMAFFKIDGTYRSKIGIPSERCKGICGSYDSQKKVLTLLWCSIPSGTQSYVNSKWGEQSNPFDGDVINAYNDGPVEDGSIMGPFYEIETSSPAAALAPGQYMQHLQSVVHLCGEESELSAIVHELFNIDLKDIVVKFQ